MNGNAARQRDDVAALRKRRLNGTGSDDAIVIDAEGWASCRSSPVDAIRSPNQDARPDGEAPSLIVVHAISLPPGCFGRRDIDALFTNRLDAAAHPYFEALRNLRVSSHFLIRRDGALAQFVSCASRAWHAGVSSFGGRERCNDYSIGIEMEGDDATPFESCQYAVLGRLVDASLQRYPIVAIAAHSEIAPGRKTDPGPCFEWHRVMFDRDPSLRTSIHSPD